MPNIRLAVTSAPSITTQPANQFVFAGGTATFSVTASGATPLAYQWRSNGVDIAGVTSSTLTLANAQAAWTGSSYAVVITNAYGSVTSSVATLTVEYPLNFTWARRAGGSQGDRAYGVAVDASNNVYVTGTFRDTLTLGADTLVSAGDLDAFLAKYDSAGNVLWARRAGGSAGDRAYGVAVSVSGDVFICGFFDGSATFGGTGVTSAGATDGFLAKYDSAGNVLWVRTGGGNSADENRAVAVDSAGNAYVTGEILGSATFGSTTLGSGGTKAHLVKYNGDGNVLWARQGTSGGEVSGYGVAADSSGNVFITGFYSLGADFGGVALTGIGARDVYLVKYDGSGTELWGRNGGGSGSDYGFAVRADAAGNAYVAGQAVGTVNFGTVNLSCNGGDGLLVKYDASGNALWARNVGAAQNDTAQSLALDAAGNPVLVGDFLDQLNLGANNQTSSGGSDAFAIKYAPDGTVLWSRKLGGTGTDVALGAAAASDGSVYVAGFFNGTATAGAQTITSAGGEDAFVAKLGLAPVITAALESQTILVGNSVTFSVGASGGGLFYQWQRNGVNLAGANSTSYTIASATFADSGGYRCIITNAYGSVTSSVAVLTVESVPEFQWIRNGGGTGEDAPYALATDTSGNVLFAGHFSGTAAIGTNTFTSAGFYDIFVAKYDAAGNFLWSRGMGSSDYDDAYGVAADAAGNVYLTGYFSGTVNFGGTSLSSAGGRDLFIAKYDPAGTLLWARSGGGGDHDYGKKVQVDVLGNVYLLGSMGASGTFGGVALTINGNVDMVLIKYDANGNPLWTRRGGGAGYDYVEGLGLDSTGNPIVSGSYSGTAVFDGFSLPVTSVHDVFVVKFSAVNGSVVWAQRAGGSGDENAYGLTVDAANNVYVTGLFNGTSVMGETTLTSAGSYDYFLLKLNSSGVIQWARRGGGGGDDRSYDTDVTPSGNVVIIGEFNSTATFGTTNLTSAGAADIFLVEYDASGNVLWAQRAGGTGLDSGGRVTVDATSNVYLAGVASGSATFGTNTLTGLGGLDAFVAKLEPPNSAPTDILLKVAGVPICDDGNPATFDYYIPGYGCLNSLTALIVENSASGTSAGFFTATDTNSGDTATFTLVTGTGDTDNASFSISNGTNLVTAAVFDYETKNSFSIRVRATDSGGLYDEKQFTIAVSDVVEFVMSNQVSAVTEDAGAQQITLESTGSGASYLLLTGPAHGTISVVGNIATYTPLNNYQGLDTFTYILSNSFGTSTVATVTVNVANVNDILPFAFSNAVNYAVGSAPAAIAAGKFDKGSTMDLAVANFSNNFVNILLGTGKGTFTNGAPTAAVGNGPVALATANFNSHTNKDTKPDVVVVNKLDNTIQVLLGDGLGGFTNLTPVAVGNAPSAVAVGDVNKDARVDAVVANEDDNTITVLLGHGDGEFRTGTNFNVGTAPVAVAVADLNKDMKADVVAVNSDGSSVSILWGNGTGFLSNAVHYAVGANPTALAAGDFNKDGRVDLVVANYGDDTISVLLSVRQTNSGVRTNTFTRTDYPVGIQPSAVVVTNINKDAYQDIIVAGYYENTVQVLLGRTNGAFEYFYNDPSATEPVGTNPIALAVGNFNADTDLDVAVANWGSGNVSILLNNYTPVAYAQKVNVTEDTATSITLTATFGPLNYLILSGPTNGSLILTNGAMSNATASPVLTYLPTTNANGKDLITFKVQDDGGKTSKVVKVEIVIIPVNDAPSFSLASNAIELAEDSPKRNITNFATDLDRGASGHATEIKQPLYFTVTNDNPGLFLVAPGIIMSGTNKTILTFQPAKNAHGTATVGVRMYDKGMNPATNYSAWATFTLTVTNVNDTPVLFNWPAAFPTVKTNSSTNITFAVWDADTGTNGLYYSVTWTNTALFPDAGDNGLLTVFASTNFVFGTVGTNRTLTLSPAFGQKGTDKLIVTIYDGTNSISKTNSVMVK